jgi:hypothetical protein
MKKLLKVELLEIARGMKFESAILLGNMGLEGLNISCHI